MYGFTLDLFEGRCVVVTGAARGIGRATALAFAEHGAALVLVDRDANVLEATAREVLAAGAPSCRTLLCDLGVEQQRNDQLASSDVRMFTVYLTSCGFCFSAIMCKCSSHQEVNSCNERPSARFKNHITFNI
jgi:short-subunit dehydrogenase